MESYADVTTWTPDAPDAPDAPSVWTGEVPPTWMQGRASFGGIVAAVGLRALRAAESEGRVPRSIHTSFFGPLGRGPARVTAQIVRRGRSLTHGRAEIWQGDAMQGQVMATFADDRDSAIVVEGPTRPVRPGPEGLAELPYIEGVVPAFTRAFEFRWTDGAMPFSGSKETKIGGWCRHRTDPGDDPYAALVGLLDAWPSPVMAMLDRPRPASSVSWSTMFFDVPAAVGQPQWWWYGSETVAARHGYAGLRASLYGPNGQLAATVEQLVAVFDRPAS